MTNVFPAALMLHHHSVFGNDFLVLLLRMNKETLATIEEEKVLDKFSEERLLADTVFDTARGMEEVARAACDRKTGAGAGAGGPVGADGFIVAPHDPDFRPDDKGSLRAVMVLRNADGSFAEMSSNGVRCLAHACITAAGRDAAELKVLTGGGLHRVNIYKYEDPPEVWASVGMHRVLPGPIIYPGVCEAVNLVLDETEYGQPRRIATGSVGNPHLVIDRAQGPVTPGELVVSDEVLTRLSRAVVPFFPQGINVEVIAPLPATDGKVTAIAMAVHERGVGITKACGTGAAVSAVRAAGWSLVGGTVIDVVMPGGTERVALATPVCGEEAGKLVGFFQDAESEHLADHVFDASQWLTSPDGAS
ncbi:MAG TPA: hypothetical protein DEP66_06305 [Acidimicrobiaceae bacterium]|nr:hypothetical protein [Acidimicrobiaceae bacterium]